MAAAPTAREFRLWKVELQKLADEKGLTITVCHYPPGTSKWNRIEHRLFCHITQNWRGTPLTSRLAVVELIAATTTKAGLTVRCVLDENSYPKGVKVTDEELAALNIQKDAFHPEWNYTIRTARKRDVTLTQLFRGVALVASRSVKRSASGVISRWRWWSPTTAERCPIDTIVVPASRRASTA